MADLTGTNIADADTSGGTASRERLPEGTYTAAITNEIEKTSAAGNRYLSLRWEILEGEHRRTWVFQSINLWHPKPEVAERARGDIARICDAVGCSRDIKDTVAMQNRAALITVEHDGDYERIVRIEKATPGASAPKPLTGRNDAAKQLDPSDIPF